jgi:hypothetical protein
MSAFIVIGIVCVSGEVASVLSFRVDRSQPFGWLGEGRSEDGAAIGALPGYRGYHIKPAKSFYRTCRTRSRPSYWMTLLSYPVSEKSSRGSGVCFRATAKGKRHEPLPCAGIIGCMART